MIKKQNKPSLKKINRLLDYEDVDSPVLRFSPTAWAKLLYFRDQGETEIGGFGITSPNDLLFVEDFMTVKQEASVVSISFDDEAVADFFEDQVDLRRQPQQFARIWLHSHPGNCPNPSGTDEDTFQRVFGECEWAVMFIIAEDGSYYARLRFNVGPGCEIEIPVEIDYECDFGSSDIIAWQAEYKANIQAIKFLSDNGPRNILTHGMDEYSLSVDMIEELKDMDPAERQYFLEELAERPDLWNEESGVMQL